MDNQTTKTALAYAIGMIQSMPQRRQDYCPLHEMRTDILENISAVELSQIVTDAEMQSGKAVNLYGDYMESRDPAGVLFKATYNLARGRAYTSLIKHREQHPTSGKDPDPTVMAKRAGVCLDDVVNLRAAIVAHGDAVGAFEKLGNALLTSQEVLEGAAEPQPTEEVAAMDAFPPADTVSELSVDGTLYQPIYPAAYLAAA